MKEYIDERKFTEGGGQRAHENIFILISKGGKSYTQNGVSPPVSGNLIPVILSAEQKIKSTRETLLRPDETSFKNANRGLHTL